VKAEGIDERHVGGVAAAGDDDATDAAGVVARVEGMPFAAEKDLDPG